MSVSLIPLASEVAAGVPEVPCNCNAAALMRPPEPANPMILPLFRRAPKAPSIAVLYGTIVAQARSPAFYRGYGVPDTVGGRTDMIMLHLLLVLRRLRASATDLRPMGQALFDRFCRDMDDNLREMGVGDLAVPKRMQRVGEAFYGRAKAYDAALDGCDTSALVSALERNVFGSPQAPLGARRLATYMQETLRQLSAVDDAALARSELEFPDPEAIGTGEVSAGKQ
jgi:cytochrome b pre-mRNA-processing protein 3